jgi:hypothetical protein
MKPIRTCSNCIKGSPISINNDIFCRDKGLSPRLLLYQAQIYTRSPSNTGNEFQCIHLPEFVPYGRSGDNTSIGLCRLFSVRQYDGEQKNICSKFIRKLEKGVS